MKKKIILFFTAIFGIILLGGVIMLFRSHKTNLSTIDNGIAVFKYGEVNISEKLSDEDLNTIQNIFDNKKLYKDDPSCGFSDNIAVVLDGTQVFCIACDECPIIYYKNEGLFFKLSDHENELLRNVLIQYGFHFPCV